MWCTMCACLALPSGYRTRVTRVTRVARVRNTERQRGVWKAALAELGSEQRVGSSDRGPVPIPFLLSLSILGLYCVLCFQGCMIIAAAVYVRKGFHWLCASILEAFIDTRMQGKIITTQCDSILGLDVIASNQQRAKQNSFLRVCLLAGTSLVTWRADNK